MVAKRDALNQARLPGGGCVSGVCAVSGGEQGSGQASFIVDLYRTNVAPVTTGTVTQPNVRTTMLSLAWWWAECLKCCLQPVQ